MMNNIKSLRKEKSLTVEQLAKKIGVAKSSVSAWENGKSEIRGKNLKKLSDYFGVSDSYLLGYSKYKKYEPIKEIKDKIDWTTSQIDILEHKIKTTKEHLDNLKKEYSKGYFKTLDGSYLLDYLLKQASQFQSEYSEIPEFDDIVEDTRKKWLSVVDEKVIEEEYQRNIEILEEDLLGYDDLLISAKSNLTIYKNLVEKRKKGEEIPNLLSSDDLENGFKDANISQSDVSAFLRAIPYFLNVEDTMKITEYAQMLMEKQEKTTQRV